MMMRMKRQRRIQQPSYSEFLGVRYPAPLHVVMFASVYAFG